MSLLSAYFRQPASLLPSLSLQTADLHLGWALVLAALCAYLLRPFPKPLRAATILLVFSWVWVPSEWGLGWWLGLAYQTPSLTMQGLAALYLLRVWQMRHADTVATLASVTYARWPNGLLVLAVVAGWLLALDTFAIFKLNFYPLGFTHAALFIGLLLSAVLWLLSQRSNEAQHAQKYRDLAVILLISMAFHVLTGLPNGNVWNALMDPWLWLLAQGTLLLRAAAFMVFLLRSRLRLFAK